MEACSLVSVIFFGSSRVNFLRVGEHGRLETWQMSLMKHHTIKNTRTYVTLSIVETGEQEISGANFKGSMSLA